MLEGDGTVATTGVVVPDEASPSGSALRVWWRPSATHAATVLGVCSADFKRSIEAMYLSVTHGAEFAIPAAGAGKRVERLSTMRGRWKSNEAHHPSRLTSRAALSLRSPRKRG